MVCVRFPLRLAHLPLNRVHSIATARLLPPPGPFGPNCLPHTRLRPFEPGRSSPISTMSSRARSLVSDPTVSIRAQSLVSHFHQAPSSTIACLPPSTRSFRARSLISDPTVFIRAQPLVSCFHQALSSLATCLPLNHINSSATALVPPPPCSPEPNCSSPTQPCPFEHNCSSPASTRPFQVQLLASHPTVSIRVQLLVSYSLPGLFRPNRLSLTQPCPFEHSCSSPASTRPFQAQPLCLPLNCFNSSTIACLPPPPRRFKPGCSSPTPTMSIRV